MVENISPEYIDYNGLLVNCANKEELAARLLSLFIQQAPLWIKDIEEAYLSGDAENIRAVCHRVKGGAGTVQAHKICDETEKLSAAAKENMLQDAEGIVSSVLATINETIAFVESLDSPLVNK